MKASTTFKMVLAAVAASMALAACTGGSGGDKAGGETAPVTLRIGTNDDPGKPGAAQIEEFSRQVQELSKGQVRIEPVWRAAGDADDWDQVVARRVVRGDLDLGMIPARAWDTEGVTSLRALNAPFLVTSDNLAAQIVKGVLAPEMLAGLEAVGVTGLALLPEGLRHVFAFRDPPLSPADYEGMVIRAHRSETTYALFEALGAKPDDFGGGPGDARFAEFVRMGQAGGAESAFSVAGSLPAPTTAVGNVTFFPKVNSLVVNTDAFQSLPDGQQAILRDAATRTVDWAIKMTRSDAELAKVYCANGGRIVLARQAEVAKFEQAVQAVYDQLEQDEATKVMIARIRSLSEEVGTVQTAVEPCGKGTDVATAGDKSATSFPEGVYRADITEEFLLQAGIDAPSAYDSAAIWTLTFKNGEFNEWDSKIEGNPDPTKPTCPGSTYSVEGSRVTIRLGQDGPGCGSAAGKELFSARWTLQGDQLRFLKVRSGHGSDLLVETLFGGKPFIKIG
jgi:TRAP-type C4-dicarboxylate transport system substrate-binding protein